MGVLSLGIMDIRGIWRKWKEQNAPTRKQKTQKKIGTLKEFGEIRRRNRTNQKLGIKRKNRNIDQGNFGEMKGKNAPIKKIGRPGNRPTNEKIKPRKIRSSARRRRLGIAGIGVITGPCALKILGPFGGVSYIAPSARDRAHQRDYNPS